MKKSIVDFKEFAKVMFDRNFLQPILADRYIDIVEDRIKEELSFDEIANKYNISTTRASHMYSRSLEKIRRSEYVKSQMALVFELHEENIQKAHQINAYAKALSRIEDAESRIIETIELARLPLEDLGMSVRLYNCLKRARLDNLQDVVLFGRENLMGTRNMGKVTIKELEALLQSHNIALSK